MAILFTVLLILGVVGTVTVRFAGPQTLRNELQQSALPLAWLVAITATAGSLYFSEVAGYTPCEFCWYQRIAMYPLVLTLGVAVRRRDPTAIYSAIPLAVIGALIALYHYQLQLFPDQSSFCSSGTPCTLRWIETFGIVSIPLMALVSFILIIMLLLINDRTRPIAEEPHR